MMVCLSERPSSLGQARWERLTNQVGNKYDITSYHSHRPSVFRSSPQDLCHHLIVCYRRLMQRYYYNKSKNKNSFKDHRFKPPHNIKRSINKAPSSNPNSIINPMPSDVSYPPTNFDHTLPFHNPKVSKSPSPFTPKKEQNTPEVAPTTTRAAIGHKATMVPGRCRNTRTL